MRPALFAALALTLAACQPRGDHSEAPPPEAVAFAGEFDARGDDWTAQIRRAQITLERKGQPALVVANPGRIGEDDQGVWSTMVGGETPFIVTLVDEGECRDGTTDLLYPYVAVVTLGEATLRGCAAKLAAPAAAR